MTLQLVDRAHTDSCVVIGCKLQPRATSQKKMNTFISGRSHIAVIIIVNNALRTNAVTILSVQFTV